MATTEANAAKMYAAQEKLKQQITILASPKQAKYIDGAPQVAPNEPEYAQAEFVERVANVLEQVNAASDSQEQATAQDLEALAGIEDATADILREHGFTTKEALAQASDEALRAVPGIGTARLAQIRGQVGRLAPTGPSEEDRARVVRFGEILREGERAGGDPPEKTPEDGEEDGGDGADDGEATEEPAG